MEKNKKNLFVFVWKPRSALSIQTFYFLLFKDVVIRNKKIISDPHSSEYQRRSQFFSLLREIFNRNETDYGKNLDLKKWKINSEFSFQYKILYFNFPF